MVTSTLRTVGGSVMMAIPKTLLEGLGLAANAKVALHIEAGRLVVEPRPRQKYTLSELVAQCEAEAAATDELQVWEAMEPVGREVL